MSVILFSLPAAGVTERLARVSSGEDVGVDACPVDGAQVPEVGGVRESVGEDGAGVAVDVGYVGGVGVEHGFDGEIEAAVPGAQADDLGRHAKPPNAHPTRNAGFADLARPAGRTTMLVRAVELMGLEPTTPCLQSRGSGPCDQVFPQVTARALPRRTPSGTMLRVGLTRTQRAAITSTATRCAGR